MSRNIRRDKQSNDKAGKSVSAELRSARRLLLSRHIIAVTMIMLLLLGGVGVSFAYLTDLYLAQPSEGSLILDVRTAKNQRDLAASGAEHELAQTGTAKERYIYCGISNNFDNNKDNSNWGFNFWGGTSEGVKSGTWIENVTHDGRNYHVYRVTVYDDNNKAQFKGNSNWWVPNGGFSVTLNGTSKNAVFFSSSNDGWDGQFQRNYIVSSTASLTASASSTSIGQNVTLTPALTSNDDYNDLKSVAYAVTKNGSATEDATVSQSNNIGTFTATAPGSYTVTATVTYNAKDFTDITATVTATATIDVGVTFSEKAVVYFDMGSWWSNSGCYEYAAFKKTDGTSVTLPLYNLATFNSSGTKSTASSSSGGDTTFFAELDAGSYIGVTNLYRKKTNDANGENHNSTSFDPPVFLSITSNKNNTRFVNDSSSLSFDTTMATSTIAPVLTVKANNSSSNISVTKDATVPLTATNTKGDLVIGTTTYSGTGVSGSNFSYATAGVYTVTGTFNYHERGYSSLSGSATDTIQITVKPRLTFNTNGGSAVAAQDVAYNGTPTRPATDPTKTDHRFDDWYADAACTIPYDFSAPLTAHATAYAGWIDLSLCEPNFTTATKTIYVGEQYTQTANHYKRNTQHTVSQFTYSVPANNGVAIINSSTGQVTGVAPGQTTVTATCVEDGTTCTYSVTVINPSISVNNISGVSVNTTNGTITPTLSPATQYGTISYSSGNTGVIQFNQNGTYKAVAPGTATITATYHYSRNNQTATVTDTFTITVTDPTLTFDTPAGQEIEQGRTGTVSVSSTTPTPTAYQWSVSSDTSTISTTNTYYELRAAASDTSVIVHGLDPHLSNATADSKKIYCIATYAGGYKKAYPYTVTIDKSNYYLKRYDNDNESYMPQEGSDNQKTMLFSHDDDQTHLTWYKYEWQLNANSTYRFVVYDADDGKNYSYSNTYYDGCHLTDSLNLDSGGQPFSVYDTVNSSNCYYVDTTIAGIYRFYFSPTNYHFCVEYPHTATFDKGTAVNDVTFVWPATQTITYYGLAERPATDPTATGFTFDNWYSDSGLTTLFNFSSNIIENTTIYAKWTADTTSVTLDKQGGSGGDDSVTATYRSAMPAITAPTKTGYNFQGYYDQTYGHGNQYYTDSGASAQAWDKAATPSITLYTYWTPKTSQLLFDVNGGDALSGTINLTATYGQAMPVGTNLPPVPTREGYTFTGYYDSTADNAVQYYDENCASARTWDKDTNDPTTLYAHWTINSHPVTFVAKYRDGVDEYNNDFTAAELTEANLTGAGSIVYGSSFTLTAHDVTGYTFMGIYDSSGIKVSTGNSYTYTLSSMPDNSLEYTARYTKNFAVTLTITGDDNPTNMSVLSFSAAASGGVTPYGTYVYSYKIDDGGWQSIPNINAFTPTVTGTYTFRVDVSDHENNSAYDEITKVVAKNNTNVAIKVYHDNFKGSLVLTQVDKSNAAHNEETYPKTPLTQTTMTETVGSDEIEYISASITGGSALRITINRPSEEYYISSVTITKGTGANAVTYTDTNYHNEDLTITESTASLLENVNADITVHYTINPNPIINVVQPEYGSVYVTSGDIQSGLTYYFNGDNVPYNTELTVHVIPNNNDTYNGTDRYYTVTDVTATDSSNVSESVSSIIDPGTANYTHHITTDTTYSAVISYAFDNSNIQPANGSRRIFFTDNKSIGSTAMYAKYASVSRDYTLTSDGEGGFVDCVVMSVINTNGDNQNVYYADIPLNANYVMFHNGDPDSETNLPSSYTEYATIALTNNAFYADLSDQTVPYAIGGTWMHEYADYRTVGSASVSGDAQQAVTSINKAAVFIYTFDFGDNALRGTVVDGSTCDISLLNGNLSITPRSIDNNKDYALIEVRSLSSNNVKYYLVRINTLGLNSLSGIQRLYNSSTLIANSFKIIMKVLARGDNINFSYQHSAHNADDYQNLTGTSEVIDQQNGHHLSKYTVDYNNYIFYGPRYIMATVDNGTDTEQDVFKTEFDLDSDQGDSIIYFKNSTVFPLNGLKVIARFGNVWTTMQSVGGDEDLYRAVVPDTASTVIFYLMYEDKYSADASTIDALDNDNQRIYYYSKTDEMSVQRGKMLEVTYIGSDTIGGSFTSFSK